MVEWEKNRKKKQTKKKHTYKKKKGTFNTSVNLRIDQRNYNSNNKFFVALFSFLVSSIKTNHSGRRSNRSKVSFNRISSIHLISRPAPCDRRSSDKLDGTGSELIGLIDGVDVSSLLRI